MHRDDTGWPQPKLCQKVCGRILLWTEPETEVWNVSLYSLDV